MLRRARLWVLWLVLLAVFAGQPLGHCAEFCCAGGACSGAEPELTAPVVHAAHEAEHLPCVHQSLGDAELLLGSASVKKCCTLPPPVLACAPVAAGVAAVRGRGQPQRPVPPLAGLCLPMLC